MENRLKQVAMCGKKNVKRKTMNKGYLRRAAAERRRTAEAYSPTPRTRQAAHPGRAHAPTGRAGRSPQRRAHPKGHRAFWGKGKKIPLSGCESETRGCVIKRFVGWRECYGRMRCR